MIKVLAPAQRHPTNRPLPAFHRYWAESHGPLFAQTRSVRRYVQHLALPELYTEGPAPTFDGASMFWYDDLEVLRSPSDHPFAVALRAAVRADDAQLFDREPSWPLHQKRASITATEHVVLDGPTTPEMVKALFIVARHPGLTRPEFFDHWLNVHGPLAARVPGLRRYVQNHALPEADLVRPMTHDGWAELWFDDLGALRAAMACPQWAELQDDGRCLFAQPLGFVAARERVQKSETHPAPDFNDVAGWSEGAIRDRLRREGYMRLAADPDAPKLLQEAAAAAAIAVWTDEHLVTIRRLADRRAAGAVRVGPPPERAAHVASIAPPACGLLHWELV